MSALPEPPEPLEPLAHKVPLGPPARRAWQWPGLLAQRVLPEPRACKARLAQQAPKAKW